MIQAPRRSITRFFIPMIDVLTLLFCIFLLMPFVKSAGEAGDVEGSGLPPAAEPAPGDAKELAKKVERLQQDIEQLKKEKAEALQKTLIRTLEIGREDGKLYYYAGSDRFEVRDQDDAIKLIANHRKDQRKAGAQELYYLFLYPRAASAFPTEEQITRYQRWFAEVSHGFDNPKVQE